MSDERSDGATAPRRRFLAGLGALAVGAVAVLPAVGPGLAVLLDPLRRKSRDAGMVLVTKLALLGEGGSPKKFTVRAERVDGWTTYEDTPVGAVYLRRTESGVNALNVACPHAGCFVNLAPDGSRFACPCHKSSFDLDGRINDPASPAPRDMDALEVEVRNGDEVWVRFRNFLPGQKEKTPVA